MPLLEVSTKSGELHKEEWLSEVQTRSKELETPKDRLVLFAGSDPNPRAPMGKVYASLKARRVVGPNSTGFVTIGATTVGRDLEAAQLYHNPTSRITRRDAQEIWGAASREICRQASGNVTVLLRPNASKETIFFREELPTFMQNERVMSINGVPIEQLRDRPLDEVRSRIKRTFSAKRRSGRISPQEKANF